MPTKPGSNERLQVAGIPQPLYEALITIAAREGKTLSRVGLDALELLARDRGEWPPGQGGRRGTPSRSNIALATEQVMALLERREGPVPGVEAAKVVPVEVRQRRDGRVTVTDLRHDLRVTMREGAFPGGSESIRHVDVLHRRGEAWRLYIARDEVVKVLRACFARGACPGCCKSPNGDWRGWHADDCALVAFCESNGIALSEVEDG